MFLLYILQEITLSKVAFFFQRPVIVHNFRLSGASVAPMS
jgi:hypothetical protein